MVVLVAAHRIEKVESAIKGFFETISLELPAAVATILLFDELVAGDLCNEQGSMLGNRINASINEFETAIS